MFDKGVSSNSESWIIGFGTGVLFSVIVGFVGCGDVIGDGDDGPHSDAEHDCEVAYEESRDGDDDEPEAIVNEAWCQEHNTQQEQIRALEDQEQLQDQMEQVATP